MNAKEMRIRVLMSALDGASGPVKKLAQASSKTARVIKDQEKAVRSLQRAQGNVESFRKVRAEIGASAKAYRDARSHVARLRAEYSALEAPTRKQTTALNAALRASDRARQTYQLQAGRLAKLRDEFRQAGASAKNLGVYEDQLKGKISRATTEIAEQTKALDKLKKRQQIAHAAGARAEKLNQRAGQLAAGGAVATAGGAMVGLPLLAAAQDAGEYESRLTDIRQKADLARGAAAGLSKEIRAQAKAANLFPAEYQEILDGLAGRGQELGLARQNAPMIAKAARAFKADPQAGAQATDAALDNMGVKTSRALDIMAFGDKEGAVSFEKMSEGLPELTAGYRKLGAVGDRAFADLVAAQQIAAKAAGSPEEAINNVSNLIDKTRSPETAAAFKKMGVDLFKEMDALEGAGRTPIEAITELTNKTLKGNTKKLGFLFGDKQARDALAALIPNVEKYLAMRDEALQSKGLVDAAFADRMLDAAEKTRALQVAAQDAKLELGGSLAPAISDVATKLLPLVEGFGKFAKENPNFVKVAAIVVMLVAGLGALALMAAAILAPFAILVTVAGALGLPFIAVGAAIVTAVALVGWAIAAIVKHWDGLKTKAGEIFTSMGHFIVQGLVFGIKAMLGPLGFVMEAVAKMLPDSLKKKLGIKSPSRVFAALGGHVMDGLAMGLERGENGPLSRIRGTAAALTAAAGVGLGGPAFASGVSFQAPPAMAPAGGAAAAPINMPITVKAGPGMDERALARLVAEEVRKVLAGQDRARLRGFGNEPDGD